VLRPNQYVRAHLSGARRPNAIMVPQRAVQQGAKGHFVWVISADKKAEARPVEVGDWHGDDWFINEGLASGDEIAVDGTLRVAPGATVIVTPYVPTPARHAATAPIAPPAAANPPGNAGTAQPVPPPATNK
jgi:membrane fusion protein (multidrug efflux system)